MATDLQIATSEGFQAGGDAASWIIDGNTTDETRHRLRRGIEDGNPEVMDLQPSPLSGEWAGESIPELSARFGIDLANEDIAEAFEVAFGQGFWCALEDMLADA